MIHITEKKLRAAIQISMTSERVYSDELEEALVHDIKALSVNGDKTYCTCLNPAPVAEINGTHHCDRCGRNLT